MVVNSFKQEASKGTKMSGYKYDEKQTIYVALSVSLHRHVLVSKGKTVTTVKTPGGHILNLGEKCTSQ